MKTLRNSAVILLIGALLLLLQGCRSSRSNDNSSFEPVEYASAALDISSNQERNVQDDISNSRRNAITQAVEMVTPAVAGISVKSVREIISTSFEELFWYGRSYKKEESGLGSGFIISEDGYILTNEHVIGDATDIIVSLTDGKTYDAELVERDKSFDIALLKIEGNNFPSVKLGDSDDILIGEWAIAFGNPFGLFEFSNKPSVTVGVISAVDLYFGEKLDEGRIFQDMIQTDASINPGNSGGPLVNSQGEVIGMNTFIFTAGSESEGSIGIGFAIPINKIKQMVPELKERAERHYWIGFRGYDIDRRLAIWYDLDTTVGFLIAEVDRNSPAEKAKLKPGDIITEVNGKNVKSSNDIMKYINETDPRPGTKIKLKILRNRQTYETTLTLERPQGR